MVLQGTVKLILPIAEVQCNLFVLYLSSLCGDEIKADIWLQFCWNWASDTLYWIYKEKIFLERKSYWGCLPKVFVFRKCLMYCENCCFLWCCIILKGNGLNINVIKHIHHLNIVGILNYWPIFMPVWYLHLWKEIIKCNCTSVLHSPCYAPVAEDRGSSNSSSFSFSSASCHDAHI